MDKSFWIIFSLILLVVPFIHPATSIFGSQGEGGAIIEDVSFQEKIYDGEVDALNITVLNLNVAVGEEEPQFFFRVFIDAVKTIDEASHTWTCQKGFRVKRSIVLSNLEGPSEHSIRVDLFWLNETVAFLQDSSTLKVKVVKLILEEWTLSPHEIEVGRRGSIDLEIGFRNSGNDLMGDLSIRVVEGGGLILKPDVRNIGDLSASGKGVAKFEITDTYGVSMGLKEVVLEASYEDYRGIWHRQQRSFTITVKRQAIHLDLTAPKEAAFNSTVLITAQLLDSDNSPIKDGEVSFTLDDNPLGSNWTGDLGRATIGFKAAFEVGDHRLSAHFTGSQMYEEASVETVFTVIRAGTLLRLEVLGEGEVDKPIIIKASLADGSGTPIGGEPIYFYFDDVLIASRETDGEGASSFQFIPENRGFHEVGISYNGSRWYEGDVERSRINVKGIGTEVSLSIPRYTVEGSSFMVEAHLKGADGTVVSSAEVNLILRVDDRVIVEEVLLTDEGGGVEKAWVIEDSGKITVEARFEGNSRYEGSSTTATGLIMSRAILLVIGIIGAGVSAGIVSLIEIKKGFFRGMVNRVRGSSRFDQADDGRSFQLIPGESSELVQKCDSCGGEMVRGAMFCDRCGAKQGLLEEDYRELDERVFEYILGHGGEISVKEALADLKITRGELLESIDRLRRMGRIR